MEGVVAKIGVFINPAAATTAGEILEQARAADRQGFESVWLGDHLIDYHGEPYAKEGPLESFTLMTAIGAVIGLVVGLAKGLGTRSLATLVLGALAGFGLGSPTAAAPGPRVGIAIAIACGLAVWIAWMIKQVAGADFDTDRLMARYTPTRTIQATKETIEWARERMPLSKRS
jgi:hypothetical protein